jgi:sulfatase modifying factor 1
VQKSTLFSLVVPAALVGAACATAPRPAPPPVVRAACPDEMALVVYDRNRVCVDRYEGAVAGVRHSHSLDGKDLHAVRAIPAKGIKPQVNISELQAQAACAGSSKRLCTVTEWTAACRGPKHFAYPYGNDYARGTCNEGRPSPVMQVMGPSWGRLDDPRLAEVEHTIEPGGAFPGCVTAAGIFDMHGNVHEWVSGSPREGDGRYGSFMGGFFADASLNGRGCSYQTVAHFKEYHDYSTGFRCCKDAL